MRVARGDVYGLVVVLLVGGLFLLVPGAPLGVRAVGVLFALVASGIVVARPVAAHRRNGRHRAWAAANGWTHVASEPALARRWWGTPFDEPRDPEAVDVLHGVVDGYRVASFTLRGVVRRGDSSTTREWHVVAWELPVPLPTLEIVPREVLVIGSTRTVRFGWQAFDAAWWVRADDPLHAYAVVHPELREALIRPPALGTRMRFEHGYLLTWSDGAAEPGAVPERLAVLRMVLRSVPDYVWRDHGWGPQAVRA